MSLARRVAISASATNKMTATVAGSNRAKNRGRIPAAPCSGRQAATKAGQRTPHFAHFSVFAFDDVFIGKNSFHLFIPCGGIEYSPPDHNGGQTRKGPAGCQPNGKEPVTPLSATRLLRLYPGSCQTRLGWVPAFDARGSNSLKTTSQ